jgi:hypothetical protein
MTEKIIFNDTYVRCHEKLGDYHVVVAADKKGIITIGGALSSIGYENVGLALAKSHF